MPIPEKYQRVLCPWQTKSELRAQIKFLDRLCQHLDPQVQNEIFRLTKPVRMWA